MILSGDELQTVAQSFVLSGYQFIDLSVLLSQSDSVDEILGSLGTDRGRARTAFEESFSWAGRVVETYFEPGRRTPPR